MNDLPRDWPSMPPNSSERVGRLRQRAVELASKARGVLAQDQRRTLEALATLNEGTARCFARLDAFEAMVVKDLELGGACRPEISLNAE